MPETATCSTPSKRSGWDQGGDKMHRPLEESALAKHLVTRVLVPGKSTKRRPNRVCAFVEHLRLQPEQLRRGKCTQPSASLRKYPCRAAWSLSGVDEEGAHSMSGFQWGPDTASAAHPCQWCLFAVFLPAQSTSEQVSLNKWPPLPPCTREEIRPWRDSQREEAKINKERTTLKATGATD